MNSYTLLYNNISIMRLYPGWHVFFFRMHLSVYSKCDKLALLQPDVI